MCVCIWRTKELGSAFFQRKALFFLSFHFIHLVIFALNSGLSHSYSTQRDKNLPQFTGFHVNGRRFDDRSSESTVTPANQVISWFS